jgi:hypothetical protein
MADRRDHRLVVDLSLFEAVGEILHGMLPPELGTLRQRTRRYGIKLWFGPETPTREHYEAQTIGADHVAGARVLALEIGFHAEHAQAGENDVVIAHLLHREKQWRRALGDDATVGPFLGRADDWRRVSETWPDPDLDDPDLAEELAARLAEYITALEPVRRDR